MSNPTNNTYAHTIQQIANLIAEHKISNLQTIRTLLYNILITNIPCTEIFKSITIELCDNNIILFITKLKIVEAAAKYEHNLTQGRRDIIHLIGFVTEAIKLIEDNNDPLYHKLFDC